MGQEITIDNEHDQVVDQQYQRAISSFEAIMLSQIELKRQLSDRLNGAIRTGLVILAIIAFSILVLLLTLSAQLNRISGVVEDMNVHFHSVSNQMELIDTYMANMERRVAMMEEIEEQMAVMTDEMRLILGDLQPMGGNISGIRSNVALVRDNIGQISVTIDQLNGHVQTMGQDMHRMGQPARSMNKMMPFFPW